jgi:hypothetical protein
MRKNFRKNLRGMSIVISTVIIIAITITMAIAVAFWAMGLGNSFTKFEKVEFVSIYADTPVNVRFPGGNTATAIVTALDSTGGISNIQMINIGSGYSSNPLSRPAVTISGGGGTGALATAIVQNGNVTAITITNPGSGYSSAATVTVTISPPPSQVISCFPVYIQLQNTGQMAATINNVFLNDKPYSAYQFMSQSGAQNLVNTIMQVGARNNNFFIYLPNTSATNFKSGDYVEVQIETTSGKEYSNTVLLP